MPSLSQRAAIGAALLLSFAASPLASQEGGAEPSGRCDCRIPDVVLERLAEARIPERVEGALRALAIMNRALLGITVEDDEALPPRGAVIRSVSEDGPAEAAGLLPGDVIVSIDGAPLVSGEGEMGSERGPTARLVAAMREVRPGDTVAVEYLRDGAARRAGVVAAERAPRMMPAPGGLFSVGPSGRIGARLATVTGELGDYFGVDGGALVLEVSGRAGLDLRPGDVIVAIGGRAVAGERDARRILSSYRRGEAIELEVIRRRERVRVSGTLP